MVFPLLGVKSLEYKIISWCDNKSLSSLSCTQKYAHGELLNDGIFKDRFLELYRSVHPAPEKLFPHFQEYYPKCCWKICSCLDPEEQSILVFKKQFLQEALPIQEQENKKRDLESLLRGICGTGYADPNSLIHQTWEACRIFKESNEEVLARALFPSWPELNDQVTLLENKLENELQGICEGTGYDDPNCPMYQTRKSYAVVKELRDLRCRFNHLEEKYKFLDLKRTEAERDLKIMQATRLEKSVLIALLVDQYCCKNQNLVKQSSWSLVSSLREVDHHLGTIWRCEVLGIPLCPYNPSQESNYITANANSKLSSMAFEIFCKMCANGAIDSKLSSMTFEIFRNMCANEVIEDSSGSMHCWEFAPQMASLTEAFVANVKVLMWKP